MVDSICVPNSTIEMLMKENVTIEFNGFSIYDFWYSIKMSEDIAKCIMKNGLTWRYDHWR